MCTFPKNSKSESSNLYRFENIIKTRGQLYSRGYAHLRVEVVLQLNHFVLTQRILLGLDEASTDSPCSAFLPIVQRR